jgi:hypothetical protein
MNDNTNTTQPIPHTQPMRFVDIPDTTVDTGPTGWSEQRSTGYTDRLMIDAVGNRSYHRTYHY